MFLSSVLRLLWREEGVLHSQSRSEEDESCSKSTKQDVTKSDGWPEGVPPCFVSVNDDMDTRIESFKERMQWQPSFYLQCVGLTEPRDLLVLGEQDAAGSFPVECLPTSMFCILEWPAYCVRDLHPYLHTKYSNTLGFQRALVGVGTDNSSPLVLFTHTWINHQHSSWHNLCRH